MGVNGVGLLFSGCLIGCAGGKGGDGLAAGMVYGEAPDAPPFQSRIKIVAERVSAVLRSAIVVVAVVAHPVAHADAGFGQQPRLFAEICPQSAAVGFGQAAQTVGRLVERAIKADEPVLRVKFGLGGGVAARADGLGVVAAGAQAGSGFCAAARRIFARSVSFRAAASRSAWYCATRAAWASCSACRICANRAASAAAWSASGSLWAGACHTPKRNTTPARLSLAHRAAWRWGWARLASVRGISGFQAAFGQRTANRFSGCLVSNFIVKRVLR